MQAGAAGTAKIRRAKLVRVCGCCIKAEIRKPEVLGGLLDSGSSEEQGVTSVKDCLHLENEK